MEPAEETNYGEVKGKCLLCTSHHIARCSIKHST